jgi:guanine nucleotide-binding protein subunit alpha
LRDLALRGAQLLINCAEETGQMPDEISDQAKAILESQVLTPAIAKDIVAVTSHETMVNLLEVKGESLQMQGGVSGVSFYWANAERFAADNFVPTHDDYFKARIKTTGIVESTFSVNGTNFTIVDVGGQRSERKKWLHCFGSVDAIIFLAAINEYDMVLEEDETENRLVESIKLWRALTNAPFFKGIPFILFLNKSDLFEKKLPKVPLQEIFADYPAFHNSAAVGNVSDFEKGWRFIKEQYAKYFAGTSFYAHTTCAIDTESCKKVFKSVQDQMFRTAAEAL